MKANIQKMRSNLEVILSTHEEILEVAFLKRGKDSHKKGRGKGMYLYSEPGKLN